MSQSRHRTSLGAGDQRTQGLYSCMSPHDPVRASTGRYCPPTEREGYRNQRTDREDRGIAPSSEEL